MSKRDEAIELVAESIHEEQWRDGGWPKLPEEVKEAWREDARSAITAYEKVMRPLLSTFDETKELPDKSVIMDATGFLYEKHTFPSGTVHWGPIGYLHANTNHRITFPVQVIHQP